VVLGNIAHCMGHQVHFASDGSEALQVYAGRSIDVVVTDLQMPNIDGLELIVRLKDLFPGAEIIAVSGKGPELLAAARSGGVQTALSKPVDPHELLRAIAEAVEGKSESLSPRWILTR
jgi:CheY-like chemotaxis protein